MNTWSRESSSSYTDTESRIDLAVQALATTFSVAAIVWLLSLTWRSGALPGLIVYSATLIATFASSLVYSHLVSGRAKELWRRVDHAVIFLLIAGTYTPLAAYRLPSPWGITVLAIVWGAATGGVFLKFAYPRRFEHSGLALCIVMGLTGAFFVRPLLRSMTSGALELLLAGAGCYLIGAVVLQLHRLRYHNALWHFLVFAGASAHLLAMAKEFSGQ
jgi:hemolysin III